MPQLTRPGVKTDQGTRYFNNPAQAAQALAQAMTQYVQPSAAVLPDEIVDTPTLPPEPASKLADARAEPGARQLWQWQHWDAAGTTLVHGPC